ncbi:hypothetical protein AMR42_16035 [Limnothrix sp. PR1529]|nr:hypothetical protein BCR12_10545 [Limnothrix sp. P13C2]PIB05467.1 hypothetical protein AMR42_16035 [Limnothrix sp. PR1529]
MQLTPERLGLTQLALTEKEAIAPLLSDLNPPAPQQNHDQITAKSRQGCRKRVTAAPGTTGEPER